MPDQRAKDLIDLGSKLFAKKDSLNSLMQEIAENFYPYRATFTTEHVLGVDYAAHLMDSHPVLVRQELGNAVSSMLRPRQQPWFETSTLDDDINERPENAQYLEYLTDTTRAAMYYPKAKFVRASKEGDHDFITFGQCVLSTTESNGRDHLYFQNHHLRDCAWLENEIGDVDHLHRKEKMSARMMRTKFGDKALHKSIIEACDTEPGKEFNVRVVALPSTEYDNKATEDKKGRKKKLPYCLIYIDADNMCMIREDPYIIFPYVVPRWATISGSPYAYSPATATALPDGRLAQQMTRILLEAGEKSVDPPGIANADAIREANLQSGGLTWADVGEGGRLQDAYMPIEITGDMRTGLAMRADLREMLNSTFFVNKLTLPEQTQGMTATEIRARLEEHVRNLLPLFEPMEQEYNTQILDNTFALLRNMGKFNFEAMPEDLSRADLVWTFKNPMQEASKRVLVEQFRQTAELVVAGQELGVKVNPIRTEKMLNDAIRGVGGPADWRKTPEEIAAELEQMVTQEVIAKAAEQAAGAAQLGEQVGNAAQALEKGGVTPPPEGQPPLRAIPGGRAA